MVTTAGVEVLEKRNIFVALTRIKHPATGLLTILTELFQLPVIEIYCTACEGSTVTPAGGSQELNTAYVLIWLIVEVTLEFSETDHEVNAEPH